MKNQKSKKSDPTSRKLVLSIERLKPQTILAPTDFSGQSLVGVRYAMNLRLKFDSSLILLHVVEPTPPMGGMESVGFGPK